MIKQIIAALSAFALTAGVFVKGASGQQASVYVVDGLALGGKVRIDSNSYRQYQCNPSTQFAGFTWCQRQRSEIGPNGPLGSSNSILHDASGTAVYVNRYIEPAFFGSGEVENQIERLSHRYGPARVQKLEPVDGRPAAVIALYGNILLEPLNETQIAGIKSGRRAQGFIPMDFLGDFQKSAQLGLPLFRISGREGYIWSASYDGKGRGTLRFLAANPQAFDSNAVWPNPSVGLPLTGFASDPSVTKPVTADRKNNPVSEQATVVESDRQESKEAAADRRADAIVAEAKKSVEIAERARQEAEAARQRAEAGRRDAERIAAEKETARRDAEQDRLKAEWAAAEKDAVTQEAATARSQGEKLLAKQSLARRDFVRYMTIAGFVLLVGFLIAFFKWSRRNKPDVPTQPEMPSQPSIITSLGGAIVRPQKPLAEPVAKTPPTPTLDTVAAITGIIDQIGNLAALHNSGTLNQEEFDRLKAKLMASRPNVRPAA